MGTGSAARPIVLISGAPRWQRLTLFSQGPLHPANGSLVNAATPSASVVSAFFDGLIGRAPWHQVDVVGRRRRYRSCHVLEIPA